jgi:hypothetical protein
MLNPGEVQDLLDDDTYRFECNEQDEIAVRAIGAKMVATAGVDLVRMFVVQWAEKNEEKVRRETPNHPALDLLDKWRAKQA